MFAYAKTNRNHSRLNLANPERALSMASSVKPPRFVVGIDLGTTNSAIAYANRLGAKRVGVRAVKTMEVDQLVAPGSTSREPMLPSSLYLPGQHELPPGALHLPWTVDGVEPSFCVGRLAQNQGSKVPGRLVTSAKSWLSYGGVDRTAPILPWGGDETVEKVSPVEASTRYLSHVVSAWSHHFPDDPLAEQDVVLTVPASFDDVARTLTLEAARTAGLGERIVLLEEPQAAFYAYFGTHLKDWQGEHKDQLVLVVDVGGGTTDLTLIHVGWNLDGDEPVPDVKRLAVGDHILLGGDNMDMALAHIAEKRITGQSGTLDAARMALLVQSCRAAKETLLGEPGHSPETYRVTIPGRGSKLIGGAQSCELTRAEVETAILDGFLAMVSSEEQPRKGGRTGLSLWGLPYAQDPVITRHVGAFLSRHGQGEDAARPDAILLNGGVFKGDSIRRRILQVIDGWREDGRVTDVLEPSSFDLAVARGAATYGLVRHGIGHRIGGGAARAYFVGVAQRKKDAVESGKTGVCLLPRHVEPGESVVMKDRVFNLILGRPVRFSLYASTSDNTDSAGELVELTDDIFVRLPAVETVLETQEDLTELPVTLKASVSDVGILEVWAESVDRDARYRLEFSLRDEQNDDAGVPDDAVEPPAPADPLQPAARSFAESLFQRTYGKASRDADPKEIRRVTHELERVLGRGREHWTLPELRALWDLLKVGMRRRRRSARHEAMFFHLSGYCLRPGFGDGFDEWRVGEMWKLYEDGVNYLKEIQNWDAWWIMWRRIAGGLDADAHARILADLTPWLRPELRNRNAKKSRLQRPEEASRLVGALERIDAELKADWGDWFLGQIKNREKTGRPAWCLARLGARQPMYGSNHQVVAPEKAEEWLKTLLQFDWRYTINAGMAAATIARRTGDRTRDVNEEVGMAVAKKLQQLKPLAHLATSVVQVVELERKDESRVFGDSLPEGLHLA